MNTKPKIVCLCGSTRFSQAYQMANLGETLAGNIVLTIGCDMRADADVFSGNTPEELAAIKARLDELHLRKIEMADEILVLNVGGYVGESTRREVAYAIELKKDVRWFEPVKCEHKDFKEDAIRLYRDGEWVKVSALQYCQTCGAKTLWELEDD